MSQIELLVESFAAQAFARDGLIQLAVLAGCSFLAWVLARALRARAERRPEAHGRFAPGGLAWMLLPVVALVIVWIAKTALRRSMPVPFLDVAVSLLVALAAIRFAIHVLRRVFPDGAFLRGSVRTISWTVWFAVALYVTGFFPGIVAALDGVELSLGKQPVTLLLLLQAVLSVAVTLVIAMWIARLIEARVLANEAMQPSTRVVIAKLVHAIAFFAAILVALPIVGIDITALSVFGGALGVGLGFGLQKIASNYVSGYIILLDRSIRIGDLVTVETRHGVVREIASRYTVLRSNDGVDTIIPNETMITQTVVNHTFTDRRAVVKVTVTIAYSAELAAATEVLLAAARASPRVIAEPKPDVSVLRLGENGVELELSAWINDPENGLGGVRSDMYKAILKGFGERSIAVPAQRREVTLFATDETQKTS